MTINLAQDLKGGVVMRGSFLTWVAVALLALLALAGCGGGGGGGGATTPTTTSGGSTTTPTGTLPTGGETTTYTAGEFTLTVPTTLRLEPSTAASSPYRTANQSTTVRGSVLVLSSTGTVRSTDTATLSCPAAGNANFVALQYADEVAIARLPTTQTTQSAQRSPSSWQLNFPATFLTNLTQPLAIARVAIPRRVNGTQLVVRSGAAAWTNSSVGNRYCLLAHGVGSDAIALTPRADDVADSSLYAGVAVLQYDYHQGADAIAAMLAALLQRPEHPLAQHPVRLDLVGHSYGGVVLRAFAQNRSLHGQLVCERVITLGTPHRGSPIADVGWLTTALQFLDGGSFDPTDGAIGWLSVGSSQLSELNAHVDRIRLTALAGTRYPIDQPIDAVDHLFGLIHRTLFEPSERNDGVVGGQSAAPLIAGAPGAYDAATFGDQHHLSLKESPVIGQSLVTKLSEGWNPHLKQRVGGTGRPVGSVATSLTGRFIAFGFEPLAEIGPDGFARRSGPLQVYLYDQLTDRLELVSAALTGQSGNNHSLSPAISADGRFVAFASIASDLVASDTNGLADVFVRDRLLGATTRVSLSTAGAQGNGHSGTTSTTKNVSLTLGVAISADGRTVAFASEATNLVTGDTNGLTDVFVRDQGDDTTTLASWRTGTEAPRGSCEWPSIDARGTRVAFTGILRQEFPSGPVSVLQAPALYLADLGQQSVALASRGPGGALPNAAVGHGQLSANGQVVVFEADVTNFDTTDTNPDRDVYWRHLATGELHCVSTAPPGALSGFGRTDASVSADGRFVTYYAPTGTLTRSVYVWDTRTGETRAVADGTTDACSYLLPTISLDGTAVTLLGPSSFFLEPNYLVRSTGVFGVDNPFLTR